MKKAIFIITGSLFMLIAKGQQKGTLGKDTYDVPGNYIGGNPKINLIYYGNDSSKTYVKLVGDTLIASDICFKNGEVNEVIIRKIKYNHHKVTITKPVFDWVGATKKSEIVLKAAAEYGDKTCIETRYLKTHSYVSKNEKVTVYFYFPNQESGEKFYNSLINGTGTANDAPSANTTSAANNTTAQNTEVKVTLKNKGKTKVLICHEEKVGSRDLSYNTINQGSSITIKAQAGCNVYLVKEGSKEKQGVLLNITQNMNNTEQVIAN